MSSFTKIYKEEIDLLYETNSMAALKVYTHLKDKYRYFDKDCYDLTRCMSEHLDIKERTIKDVIKRLKEVGLITITKRGKVNVYGFPIVDKLENRVPQEAQNAPKEAQIEPQIDEVEEDTIEDVNSPIFDDYSDNLYDFLDEHEAHIERWVNQIARGRMFGGQSEFAAIMAKENIDKLSQQLGGKNLTDFEEYINNRIISNLMLINQAV